MEPSNRAASTDILDTLSNLKDSVQHRQYAREMRDVV